MKKVLILATLLLAAGLFAQTGSISGKITDIITELPIEGIRVTLSDMYYEYPWDDSIPNDTNPGDSVPCLAAGETGFWETFTDIDGLYEFENLPEGTYSVFVDVFPEGYDPYDPGDPMNPRIDTLTFKYYPAVYPEFIELADGQVITGIDLALIPWGSDTCSIAGTVNLIDFDGSAGNAYWWGSVSVFSESGQMLGWSYVDPSMWINGDTIYIDPDMDSFPAFTEYFVDWLPPVPCYAVAEAFAGIYQEADPPDTMGLLEFVSYYPQYYDHVYTVEEATIVTPSNPILDNIDFDLEECESGGPRVLASSGSGSISGRILGNNGDVSYTTVYAKKDGKITTGMINKDGTYTLSVEPGTYEVYATRPGYKTGKHAGMVTVVDKNVAGINISMVYLGGVEEHKPDITAKHALLIETPSVSGGSASLIRYSLPEAGNVSVKIYDARGVLVRSLEQGTRTAGVHNVSWDWSDASGSRLASGIYFCRVEQNGKSAVRPLVLIK